MSHIDPKKKTVAMDKDKFDMLKKSLITSLKSRKEAAFKQVLADVTEDIEKQKTKFKGSIQWHLAWVQMDMEAKGELKKDKSTSPQKISLVLD